MPPSESQEVNQSHTVHIGSADNGHHPHEGLGYVESFCTHEDDLGKCLIFIIICYYLFLVLKLPGNDKVGSPSSCCSSSITTGSHWKSVTGGGSASQVVIFWGQMLSRNSVTVAMILGGGASSYSIVICVTINSFNKNL